MLKMGGGKALQNKMIRLSSRPVQNSALEIGITMLIRGGEVHVLLLATKFNKLICEACLILLSSV